MQEIHKGQTAADISGHMDYMDFVLTCADHLQLDMSL